jgi:hypothetical protein
VEVAEINFTDSVIVPEHGNNIILGQRVRLIRAQVDGQCWPDIQHLHARSSCAEKSQAQATWRRKDDGSPPSAHVYQLLPACTTFTFGFFMLAHVEIENPNKDIVWKHMNCDRAYIKMVSGRWRIASAENVPRSGPTGSSTIAWCAWRSAIDELSEGQSIGGDSVTEQGRVSWENRVYRLYQRMRFP